MRFFLGTSVLALAAQAWARQDDYSGNRHLWYDSPGKDLKSGMPIGNGRLGVLVHGSAFEKITLNENSVWSGPFQDRTNPGALDAFPVVRDLLSNNKFSEAGRLALANMSAIPTTNRWFSVTGDLLLDFGHTEEGWLNYERWLDTQQGNTGVRYEWNGVTYYREVIASYDLGVVAIRLTASEAGALSFRAGWFRNRGVQSNAASTEDSSLIMDVGGDDADAIPFSAGARIVIDGGSLRQVNESVLQVQGANVVDLFLNAESSFRYEAGAEYKEELNKKLALAAKSGFELLKANAVKDHESLMKRVKLDLGSSGDRGLLTTNERTAAFKNEPNADPEYLTLNYNFGRHLLISSSRDTGPSGLGIPANLQGIWNDIYNPPWGSKYTVNINTEMNYWLAEVTDLPETLPPLWDLLYRSREKGAEVARKMYGCPGYVSHHNLDVWGDSCPHDKGTAYTIWPSSNLWLSLHLMEHFHFTGDKNFLRHTAWPLFQDIAAFFDCYLFEFEGYWATGPSNSPENRFIIPEDGEEAGGTEAIDIAPTSDMSLLYEFFSNVIDAADILGISLEEDKVLSKIRSYRAGLRPIEIGAHGQIQEWREDYEESEPGHRHISHLIELYPATRMTPLVNQTLADAARVSIDRRISAGEPTGWAKSWIAACFARLLDGDAALRQIQGLLRMHTARNLFQEHNQGGPFQIDSNFGLVAALSETMLQSHIGVVHLLPAMSSTIAAGSVSGLVARGGFSVSVSWGEGGTLNEAKIVSRIGNKLTVRVADGQSFKINGKETDTVETESGKIYTITL